jgi:YHS domain-containing protein
MDHDNSNDSSYRSQAQTACGGTITNLENVPSAVYRGERVYFCILACLKAFEESPDLFMAGEIEHPVDPI